MADTDADRLAQLFELQDALEKRCLCGNWQPFDGEVPVSYDKRQYLTYWTDKFCTALAQETAELRDWTPWKHWSKGLGNKQDKPDSGGYAIELWSEQHVHEIKTEIIDALHFIIALALLWGMNADELFERYIGKNKVNHDRQDQGDY